MEKKYLIIGLSIISSIFCIFGFNYLAEAVPYQDPDQAFDYSNWVGIGDIKNYTILSENPDKKTGRILYTINVLQYLKNDNNEHTRTVISNYNMDGGRNPSLPLLDENQRILFYIQDSDIDKNYPYELRILSTKLLTKCGQGTLLDNGICKKNIDTRGTMEPEPDVTIPDLERGGTSRYGIIITGDYEPGYAPPKKQENDGVSINEIVCNERRILKHKITSLEPICVFPDSATKLMERGILINYWPNPD